MKDIEGKLQRGEITMAEVVEEYKKPRNSPQFSPMWGDEASGINVTPEAWEAAMPKYDGPKFENLICFGTGGELTEEDFDKVKYPYGKDIVPPVLTGEAKESKDKWDKALELLKGDSEVSTKEQEG